MASPKKGAGRQKRKEKKNIPEGIVYIQSTFNNTIISIADRQGNIVPSFEGEYQIKANPYRFFLGDTIWEPVEDKRGIWEFIVRIDQQQVAKKKLELI